MRSFFSVSFNFILKDCPLPYDLYVNSSALAGKDRFVRIFPIGEILSGHDLDNFKDKYGQLYISEAQRSLYLQGLVQSSEVETKKKTEVIKDSAIHYLSGVFDSERAFTTEVLNETISGCKETVSNMVDVIKDVDVDGIQKLIASLSFHDFYTYDHSINVSMYCIGLYRSLKPDASKEDLTLAGLGGLLHDLGKIKIPTEIINNPGKLSPEMFAQIRHHPQFGKDLLSENECHCDGVNLDVVRRVVFEHHENFDGTGYPSNMQGEKIHLMARVCAVADFFDAVTTKRSYHDVLSVDEAIHLMSNSSGKKLDPKVFDVFARDARVIIKSGKAALEIGDEFDPCQPCEQLDLKKVQKVKETEDYGKIKVMESGKKKGKKAA